MTGTPCELSDRRSTRLLSAAVCGLVSACVVACGGAGGGGARDGIAYFGYAGVSAGWDDPHDGVVKTDYLDEIAGFTNLAHLRPQALDEDLGPRLDAMRDAGVAAAVDVHALFFERVEPPIQPGGSGSDYRLRADFRQRWTTFCATSGVASRLASIACFYLADEPVWNGISADELATQADLVKQTFPNVPLLVIEAAPAIADLVVPRSVDWIGFDRYGVPDPANDAIYLADLAAMKARRSSSTQRVVIVMESQWFPAYGAAGYPTEAMADVARSYYRLALSDRDVIAVIGYLWPGGLDGPDYLGVRNLPAAVQSEHRRIGRAITGKAGRPNGKREPNEPAE